jgi:flagellar biosynthesis protein FliR
VTTGLLVFARCVGFALRAPGFSHPSVVPAVRAGLALFLALAITPAVTATPLDGLLLVLAFANEVVVGGTIGMVASLIYDAAYAGGRAVDDYVGVKALAPNLALVAPSGFGRVWSLAYTGAFFLLGGYRVTLPAFAESFARIPLGLPLASHAWGPYVIGFASAALLVALGVAAPAIGLSYVVQIALGALSRAVPRFGNVTLTFPLGFAAALIATVLGVPLFIAHAGVPTLSFPQPAK